MDSGRSVSDGAGCASSFGRFCLALAAVAAFVALGIALENTWAIPFKTTYRIGCATACLVFLGKLCADYPRERWCAIAFATAALSNLGLLFLLADLPASKGDLLFFAVPDAAIGLAARVATYPVSDDHSRAMWQQMVLGLVLAIAVSAIVLALPLVPAVKPH